MALHHETHPEPVEGCYACKLVTVAFGAAAMPTRKDYVNAVDFKEKMWQKDMAAYKSIRSQGLQPQRIDGCDHLSAIATSANQIEGKPKLAGREAEFITGGVDEVKKMKASAA